VTGSPTGGSAGAGRGPITSWWISLESARCAASGRGGRIAAASIAANRWKGRGERTDVARPVRRGVWVPMVLGVIGFGIAPLGLFVALALVPLLGPITPQARAGQGTPTSIPSPCTRQIPSQTVIHVPACCDDFLRHVANPSPAWRNAADRPWQAGQGGNTAPCLAYHVRDRWIPQPGSRGRCGALRFSVTFRATPKTRVLE
jgi:hypothetical protein